MVTRIRELLEARQLSPTQFADLIGVGRPVISHILSERNKPSLEVVQKVISAFPEVSLPWLLSGVGTMLATAPPVAIAAPPASAAPAPPLAVVPPTTAPVAPAPPSPATRQAPPPSSRPLPPKFRPATPLNAQFLPAADVAPAPQPAAAPDLGAPAAFITQPVAPATLPLLPLELPPASPTTTAPANLTLPLPAAPPATVAEGGTLPPAPTSHELRPAELTNSAAALSFLGEPGKAIRRIVIFYRDGSFSDYVPEGQ